MHPLLCQGTLRNFCCQLLTVPMHLAIIIICTKKPQFRIKTEKIITQLCGYLASQHWWPFVKCWLTRPIPYDVCITFQVSGIPHQLRPAQCSSETAVSVLEMMEASVVTGSTCAFQSLQQAWLQLLNRTLLHTGYGEKGNTLRTKFWTFLFWTQKLNKDVWLRKQWESREKGSRFVLGFFQISTAFVIHSTAYGVVRTLWFL